MNKKEARNFKILLLVEIIIAIAIVIGILLWKQYIQQPYYEWQEPWVRVIYPWEY